MQQIREKLRVTFSKTLKKTHFGTLWPKIPIKKKKKKKTLNPFHFLQKIRKFLQPVLETTPDKDSDW